MHYRHLHNFRPLTDSKGINQSKVATLLRIIYFHITLSLTFAVCLTPIKAETRILKNPFVVNGSVTFNSGGQRDCSNLVPPVSGLSGVPFYSDSSYSVVDKKKYDEDQERARPLNEFMARVASLTSEALQAKSFPAAACALAQLDLWASSNALLGSFNGQGLAWRRWVTNAVSVDFLAIRDIQGLDPAQLTRVADWLNRVGTAIRATIQPATNNHTYWGAAAVAAAAIAANDQTNFNWAVVQANKGIAQIDERGVMSAEMNRAGRALRYHIFALEPMMELAWLLRPNGIDLFKESNGRLQHMVEVAMRVIDHPEEMEKLAGVPQDWDKTGGHRVAWAVPYLALTSDCRAQPFINQHPKLTRTFMGGDLALLYRPLPHCP